MLGILTTKPPAGLLGPFRGIQTPRSTLIIFPEMNSYSVLDKNPGR
jgi:hypothetical protein